VDLESFDGSSLQSPEGEALLTALLVQGAELTQAERTESVSDIARLIRQLAEPINRFFDSTMVMAEDAAVRYARLTLLDAVASQLLVAGDFTKIVIEG
jgi:glycyl-tRNA synthetase beta chain